MWFKLKARAVGVRERSRDGTRVWMPRATAPLVYDVPSPDLEEPSP